ncbi:MAG TPA: hypothetical protein VGJ27_13235 [Gaiellaceae bacterium]
MRIARLLVPPAAALVLGLPLTAVAATQQILLPGPTPFPTQSPPLATANAPPSALLPFRVTAKTDERVAVGVDRDGRVVALQARHRLVLRGKGDYQIVIGAPAEGVRAAPGSDSQPGLRTGQILWAGFSPGRKVLAADVRLRPSAAAPFLPLRLRVRRDGDRYALTVTNATEISEIAYAGTGVRPELAALLDRTRRESLAGARLSSAYATILGLVRHREEAARIAAPFRVEVELRFPRPPTEVRGGTLHGDTVAFAATLGDRAPLSLTVEVSGGGTPRLRLVARPAPVVRGLAPPGAPTWKAAVRRRRLPAGLLLDRLIDTRMQLVRADQYQSFLANPDPQGRNHTVYVYETTAAPAPRASSGTSNSSSGGGSALLVTLVIVGSGLGAGAAVVAWAHS